MDVIDFPAHRTANPDREAVARHQWVNAHWERCRPYLVAALAEGLGEFFTIDDVRERLLSGDAQFWALPNGVVVTHVETYPTGLKVLRGMLSGGNLGEVQEAEPRIRAWASDLGCNAIMIQGRRGLLRALDGYHEAYTAMVRAV